MGLAPRNAFGAHIERLMVEQRITERAAGHQALLSAGKAEREASFQTVDGGRLRNGSRPTTLKYFCLLAESEGFEPPMGVNPLLISNQVPSAARPALQNRTTV